MRTRRTALPALAILIAGSFSSQAQTPEKVWRIGVLDSRQRPESLESSILYGRFIKRLRELGFVDGKNVILDWRFASGRRERLPEMAKGLVESRVDVIVTAGSEGIRAAQGATRTIPIVFNGGTDVVAQGFVKSLSRPGGNTTGITRMYSDLTGKQLELLVALAPKATRFALLVNPENPGTDVMKKSFLRAAERLNARILVVEARTPQEIDDGLLLAVKKDLADALIETPDNLFNDQQRRIADLALRYKLPSVSGAPDYAEEGGLAGYGPNRSDTWRYLAETVARVLRGAAPGEIPVEQPTKLDFVINKKTAKTLGITIPPEVLLLADRVIE